MTNAPKPLFGPNFRYTEKANELHAEFQEAFRTIFEDALADGYSPREVGHVAMWAIFDEEVFRVLDLEALGVKR